MIQQCSPSWSRTGSARRPDGRSSDRARGTGRTERERTGRPSTQSSPASGVCGTRRAPRRASTSPSRSRRASRGLHRAVPRDSRRRAPSCHRALRKAPHSRAGGRTPSVPKHPWSPPLAWLSWSSSAGRHRPARHGQSGSRPWAAMTRHQATVNRSRNPVKQHLLLASRDAPRRVSSSIGSAYVRACRGMFNVYRSSV